MSLISYRINSKLVPTIGIEPMASPLPRECSTPELRGLLLLRSPWLTWAAGAFFYVRRGSLGPQALFSTFALAHLGRGRFLPGACFSRLALRAVFLPGARLNSLALRAVFLPGAGLNSLALRAVSSNIFNGAGDGNRTHIISLEG